VIISPFFYIYSAFVAIVFRRLLRMHIQVGAALNADAESGVSLGCLELTANDALVLFPLFHAKVGRGV